MNKERLEQMKKEKLEQMKELGRGGLTKGLTFLRYSATTALSHTGSGASDADREARTSSGSSSGPRLSYDDLVALSMKLTRQNKGLKAQLGASNAALLSQNWEILKTFVDSVVGVDVAACEQDGPDESGDGSGDGPDAGRPLDASKLQERYERLQQVQQSALRHEVERLQQQQDAVDAVAVPHYDSIDLLGDPVPSGDASGTASGSGNVTGDASSTSESWMAPSGPDPGLDTQLQQWKSQVETLQQQVREQEEQAQQAQAALEQEIQDLQATNASLETTVDDVEQQVETFRTQVEALQVELKAKDELQQWLKVPTAAISEEAKEKGSEAMSTNEEQAPVDSSTTEQGVDVPKLLHELEQVCVDRAELKQQLEHTTQDLTRAEAELREVQGQAEQQATVVEMLRTETARMADERVQLETESKAAADENLVLQQRLKQLEATKATLGEQLQVLRQNSSSNLDTVVTELEESKQRLVVEREEAKVKAEQVAQELDESRKRCQELESQLTEKETQNQRIAKAHSAVTMEVMELQAQVATMQEDLQMAAEGLEAHATRAEESDALRQQVESEMVRLRLEMERLQDQHLSDLELLRSEKENELDNVKQERRVATTKLQEAQAERETVKAQQAALLARYEQETQRAADMEARISQLTAEVGNLSVDLAETKKALSDRMAMATRLRTENMTFAEKQAEQAARVESAMRDVAASRQTQVELQVKTDGALKRLHEMEEERDAAVSQMEELLEQGEEDKKQWATKLAEADAKHQAALAQEKEAFKQEVERIENEGKQKSKLALHAVLEKEAEIARLSARLAELEEDVRSGGADNRKIFEFAQLQASREMETRINNTKIEDLTTALEEANERIRQLEAAQANHDAELASMMQTQRREGVNMEYLKNVIVQFMSFKPGSSQQLRLITVIATLLEFNQNDIKTIKKASRRSTSSWTSWGAESPEFKHTAVHSHHRRSQQLPASSPNLATTPTAPDGASSRLSSFAVPEDGESVANGSHGGKTADF